jgi:hypothetical protein
LGCIRDKQLFMSASQGQHLHNYVLHGGLPMPACGDSAFWDTHLLKQPHLLISPTDCVACKLLQRQRVVVRRLEVFRLPRRSLPNAATA